ncbi:MAG TPA: hypothetical protein VMB35_05850 [Methanomicrobiales archaeon]|nr:hypothetical protein [Methanomicrobiales archaeon]
MAADSDLHPASHESPAGAIPGPRFRAGRQHVLETAFGLLSSAPTVQYLMSFIVRMRYCPDSDSCQVVIQPHYRPADDSDEEVRTGIVAPLSREIRATLGANISRKTCSFISASSALDQDNLADLFILYFFYDGQGENGAEGPVVAGVYQMNLALRTFAPEMEEIAVQALERCLLVIREGTTAA